MMALLDLGLFVIDVRLWNEDRARCTLPIEAMVIHGPKLRSLPIRLLWADDFFSGFPWNQPKCPAELRDVCTVLQSLYEYLHAQRRILMLESIDNPSGEVRLEPDLLDGDYGEDARLAWSWLLSWAVSNDRAPEGIAVPMWERESLRNARAVHVLRQEPPSSIIGSAELLREEEDWQRFVAQYHRPDLRGRRIAVLGGNRAPFKRAKNSRILRNRSERRATTSSRV